MAFLVSTIPVGQTPARSASTNLHENPHCRGSISALLTGLPQVSHQVRFDAQGSSRVSLSPAHQVGPAMTPDMPPLPRSLRALYFSELHLEGRASLADPPEAGTEVVHCGCPSSFTQKRTPRGTQPPSPGARGGGAEPRKPPSLLWPAEPLSGAEAAAVPGDAACAGAERRGAAVGEGNLHPPPAGGVGPGVSNSPRDPTM